MPSSKKRGGSNLKWFYALLVAVVVVGIGLMVYGKIRRANSAAAMQPIDLQTMAPQELIQRAKGVVIGPDSARVQVMVFSDYQCPGCAYYATSIEPLVIDQFAKTGLIKYIAHDFPLGGSHQYSFLAARGGRCAEDQGKFWEYHHLLLAQQSAWTYSRVAPVEQFQAYAVQLGLDPQKFNSCLNSDQHADLVTANYQLGQQAGVTQTPTVFIDGRQSLQPMDWDVLKAEIERALGH